MITALHDRRAQAEQGLGKPSFFNQCQQHTKKTMPTFFPTWQPRILSLLRAVIGLLFMQHGGQKIFGYPANQSVPFDLFSLSGAAGTLELVGGYSDLHWPVHSTNRFSAFGLHGGRLFHGACTAGFLAIGERWSAGSPVLLRVSLPVHRRRW